MLTALFQNKGEETVGKRKIYFELSKKFFFEIKTKVTTVKNEVQHTSEWMPRRRRRTLLHNPHAAGKDDVHKRMNLIALARGRYRSTMRGTRCRGKKPFCIFILFVLGWRG
jgi:hypothetical protein